MQNVQPLESRLESGKNPRQQEQQADGVGAAELGGCTTSDTRRVPLSLRDVRLSGLGGASVGWIAAIASRDGRELSSLRVTVGTGRHQRTTACSSAESPRSVRSNNTSNSADRRFWPLRARRRGGSRPARLEHAWQWLPARAPPSEAAGPPVRAKFWGARQRLQGPAAAACSTVVWWWLAVRARARPHAAGYPAVLA